MHRLSRPGSGANGVAIREMMAECNASFRSMRGLKRFDNGVVTISGIELAEKVKKVQDRQTRRSQGHHVGTVERSAHCVIPSQSLNEPQPVEFCPDPNLHQSQSGCLDVQWGPLPTKSSVSLECRSSVLHPEMLPLESPQKSQTEPLPKMASAPNRRYRGRRLGRRRAASLAICDSSFP